MLRRVARVVARRARGARTSALEEIADRVDAASPSVGIVNFARARPFATETSNEDATTTSEGANEAPVETPEEKARRRMSASARRSREVAESGGARRETWGWLYDLTELGETAERWTNGDNARLSDRAKTQMYALNVEDPETWTVEALAGKYRVREQRVGAILALKKREEAAVRENQTLFHDAETAMERAAGTVEAGNGERHVYDAPTMPHFQTVSAFEHGRAAKPKRFIEASELAKQQERILVRDFFDRLEYNMGERAPGLIRTRGKGRVPRRPEGGYALHVTPLGDTEQEPYVAYNDGTQRPLNDDERELSRQKTPRRRRRLL